MYFQRKIQLSGISKYPNGSASCLIRINRGLLYFFPGATASSGPWTAHYRGFPITIRHTTNGRIPLDKWSARHRDLYLMTHKIHNRRDIHAAGGIRTHNPSQRTAADTRLIPRGHWDRHLLLFWILFNLLSYFAKLLHGLTYSKETWSKDKLGNIPNLKLFVKRKF